MTMNINTQKRLAKLENVTKEIKAVFPVAGSLVSFIVTESGAYTLTASPQSTQSIRVRFTPDKTQNGPTLTNLTAVTISGANLPCAYAMEPQADDGSTVVKIWLAGSYNLSVTAAVKVIASSQTSGTFSLED